MQRRDDVSRDARRGHARLDVHLGIGPVLELLPLDEAYCPGPPDPSGTRTSLASDELIGLV